MSFMDQMAPHVRQRLEDVAEKLELPQGELVIRSGEPGGDFYRVVNGTLEVVDRSARPELVLDVLGAGSSVGEMSFLTGDARSADVRAGKDCTLLKWSEGALHALLREDPQLSAAFYRASARVLAKRLRALNAAATSGGLSGASDRAAVPEEVRGARALADRMKADLLAAEPSVRRATQVTESVEHLEEAWHEFLDSGRRLFAALRGPDADAAGALLARELNPYLVRSRLAELAITSERGRTGDPALLAHVETNHVTGADALGKALDATLQRSPTPTALRDRIRATVHAVEDALPPRAARVLVLNVGAGTTIARLTPLMANTGGEITVVDNDREALAFLNSASAAPLKVDLRLVPEDLAKFALGQSASRLGAHDVILVDGLLEYLPDRVLAILLRTLRGHTAGGTRLVLNLLTPSEDEFVFDHLLGWRTVRRSPHAVAQLLGAVGWTNPAVRYADGAGAVVVAAAPAQGMRITNPSGPR